jgi:hypothetical protein
MTNRPAIVTQTEIKRAVKAVVDAGVEVARVAPDRNYSVTYGTKRGFLGCLSQRQDCQTVSHSAMIDAARINRENNRVEQMTDTNDGHGEKWQQLVTLTNKESREFNDGRRDTCILTAHALHNVLQRLGVNSRLMRVEAAVIPDDRSLTGAKLGGDSNRKAAAPGMWKGHLVVAIGNDWLLDPTIDQVNKPKWPPSAHVGPLAIRQNWNDRGLIFIRVGDSLVRYRSYHYQNGFARKPAARPSHWLEPAERILGKVTASLL